MLERLVLVDPKPELCDHWQEAFEPFQEVEIVNGLFEELPRFDCMVSAANSFGLMDGGVDLAIINFFGDGLEKRVQNRIIDQYLGEQPVGTSFIIETEHPHHPYMAHTPTMRVPMSIQGTDHVYLAMRAMSLAVGRFNQALGGIKVVACPGLGTATGRMPAKEAARQMALAYQTVLSPPQRINWDFASKRQQAIKYGRIWGGRNSN